MDLALTIDDKVEPIRAFTVGFFLSVRSMTAQTCDPSASTVENLTDTGLMTRSALLSTWILILGVPSYGHSVEPAKIECAELIVTNQDLASGRSNVVSRDFVVVSEDDGQTGFSIRFAAEVNRPGFEVVSMSVQASGGGQCIDGGDDVSVLLRDGSRIEETSDSDSNCISSLFVWFGDFKGNLEQAERLAETEIESMRVTTRDSFVERDFQTAQSAQLQTTMACLLDLFPN